MEKNNKVMDLNQFFFNWDQDPVFQQSRIRIQFGLFGRIQIRLSFAKKNPGQD